MIEWLAAARRRLEAVAPAPFYRGRRFECPLCGGRWRRLHSFGRPPRRNALCPGCGSLERHRLLWLYLQRESDLLERPCRLLHFAPEPCLERRLRAVPTLDYTTADLLRTDVDLQVDIAAMAVEDESYDACICSHVLEHVVDDHAAISELRRILRPGGIAIVMVPLDWGRERTFEDPAITDPRERERVYGQHDHVRIYGRDLDHRLERGGFEVERVEFARALGPELSRRHAVVAQRRGATTLPRSPIWVCRRPG